ncbi:hypothetical protein AN218_13020 [Streptomyces nanshensis]|uniref:Uncharacterized protein n=1 Tax=Streptomyces nanshensis TaxID=518642 RepID=A0A1E7L5G0_9ACTN|nr:hypothetical protein AN218_13020 [Streptomyces nanshensis]
MRLLKRQLKILQLTHEDFHARLSTSDVFLQCLDFHFVRWVSFIEFLLILEKGLPGYTEVISDIGQNWLGEFFRNHHHLCLFISFPLN